MTATVRERPILMKGHLVVATLEDRKTQTRRVVRPQPTFDTKEWIEATGAPGEWLPIYEEDDGGSRFAVRCPYPVGKKLWVRETHFRYGKWVKDGKTKTGRQRWRFQPIGPNEVHFDPPDYAKSPRRPDAAWYKRPSLFMPRWASRLTLEVVSVRVERLQEITEADVEAEGLALQKWAGQTEEGWPRTAGFAQAWDRINWKRGYGWAENPFVWVLSFRRVS